MTVEQDERMAAQFAATRADMTAGFGRADERLTALDAKIDKLDAKFDRLETKLDKLAGYIGTMKSDIADRHADLVQQMTDTHRDTIRWVAGGLRRGPARGRRELGAVARSVPTVTASNAIAAGIQAMTLTEQFLEAIDRMPETGVGVRAKARNGLLYVDWRDKEGAKDPAAKIEKTLVKIWRHAATSPQALSTIEHFKNPAPCRSHFFAVLACRTISSNICLRF
jgi:hypothetical protein